METEQLSDISSDSLDISETTDTDTSSDESVLMDTILKFRSLNQQLALDEED